MAASGWTLLEVAKLIVAFLTPLLLILIGIYVHRVTKRFEQLQWLGQKLVEKRLAIYDDLAPLFNDLLCYFTYVGCWRDLKPPEVVSLKRRLDKSIHLAAPLFSEDFFTACMNFQQHCFETYTGWGRDALLRTQFERRQDAYGDEWDSDWNDCFSSKISEPNDIRAAYQRVMKVFARDIGVHSTFVVPDSGIVPHNIR